MTLKSNTDNFTDNGVQTDDHIIIDKKYRWIWIGKCIWVTVTKPVSVMVRVT